LVKCLFCESVLTDDTKPEHILLNALGGRKTSRRLICSSHNEAFGGSIDKAMAEQVAVLRNMLQLDSGTGNDPPMLKGIDAGGEKVNFRSDGVPELAGKPFTITDRGDGSFALQVQARSEEEFIRLIPHIAAKLKIPEDQLRQMLTSANAGYITKRPGPVHHPLAFGGPDAVRSITKSCLELWAVAVGNDEVRGPAYQEARSFVLAYAEPFNAARIHLDSRFLPDADELKRHFGNLFNLIYIKSDPAGRVIAHFTLYNMIAWTVVLAERGGTPNRKIGLVNNPLDPTVWSDTIADEIDIDFAWLAAPDHSLERARNRVIAVGREYVERTRPAEIGRIVDEVFDKYGIPEGALVGDAALKPMWNELAQRMASWALSLPHEDKLTAAQLAELLKKRSSE
jgi:hypothetical protein